MPEVELEVRAEAVRAQIWPQYEREVENADVLLLEVRGRENKAPHDVDDVLDRELHEVRTVTIKTTHDEVEVDGTEEVLPVVKAIAAKHYNVVHDEVVDIHTHLPHAETTLTQAVYQICLS